MEHIEKLLLWQLAFIVMGMFFFAAAVPSITGKAVSQTDDTGNFAPPYDPFNNNQVMTLTHTQIDNDTFNMDISINQERIFHNIYYYTISGWEKVSLSGSDWIKSSTSTSLSERYDQFTLGAGDDFYVGAWLCKSVNDEWECGCKTPSDCGYWHVQGIDLNTEGQTPEDCVDLDGDGYGTSGTNCLYPELDCDDLFDTVHPNATEIIYNGVDDDCDPLTLDDDIDIDGYLLTNDCNDNNNSIHPGGIEVCEDAIDQDCSGSDLSCLQCGEGSIPSAGCTCEGTNYYSGFCCNNIWQDVACGTPEVIFYDGFETGTANTWDYLNPHSAVNGDLVSSGTYALDLIYQPGTGDLKKNQHASTDLTATRNVYHRWYMYIEEDFIQPVNEVYLSWLGEEGWGARVFLRRWQGVTSDGKLHVEANGEYASSAILSNGNWYCVETEVFANTPGGSEGYIKVWIDETLVLHQTGLSFGDGDAISYLEQGGLYDGDFGDVPIHIYIDDVVVSKEAVGC